jgi:hypothetical protein
LYLSIICYTLILSDEKITRDQIHVYFFNFKKKGKLVSKKWEDKLGKQTMKVVIVHIEEAKRGLVWYIVSDNGHQVRSCPSWIYWSTPTSTFTESTLLSVLILVVFSYITMENNAVYSPTCVLCLCMPFQWSGAFVHPIQHTKN